MQAKLRYRILINVILILLCTTFVIPLIYIISLSITPEDIIVSGGYKLIPTEFDFAAYKQIFENSQQLIDSYIITIEFSLLGTFLSVVIMTMIAYALSRDQFYYKGYVVFYVYFTMLFSGGLVASYIVNTQYLGLMDSFWVYVLPGLVAPYYVFVIRTFFKGLPGSLMEAAKIDGAREFTIFTKIVLPLSKPVLATVSLLILLGKWNDWNTALLYISDAKKYSLQYLLQRILREAQFVKEMSENAMTSGAAAQLQKTQPIESMRFAMAILAAGPMMIIFPFFQKYFTKGLTIGAVKG